VALGDEPFDVRRVSCGYAAQQIFVRQPVDLYDYKAVSLAI